MVCVWGCGCVSLAPILEPECWAVWVRALWGRILCIMANTILFANSSDYCSSGCQDPNKQIIPKTNASTHSCPTRADYATATVCACPYMCMCMCDSRVYYAVQEPSLKILMQYQAVFQHSIWLNGVSMRTMEISWNLYVKKKKRKTKKKATVRQNPYCEQYSWVSEHKVSRVETTRSELFPMHLDGPL